MVSFLIVQNVSFFVTKAEVVFHFDIIAVSIGIFLVFACGGYAKIRSGKEIESAKVQTDI